MEEEEESAEPADSEEQSLFGFGGGTIFEQDVPAPTPQPSQYGLSQLVTDLNVPTQEKDPDVPPRFLATELALQPIKLDWNKEVDAEAPSDPVSEEEVVEVVRYPDPCLPSPPCEPIPQDLGCSEQRFKQEQSNQSEPVDPREESIRVLEHGACHLDTANAILGQGSSSQ